jgi:hypothetical protein
LICGIVAVSQKRTSNAECSTSNAECGKEKALKPTKRDNNRYSSAAAGFYKTYKVKYGDCHRRRSRGENMGRAVKDFISGEKLTDEEICGPFSCAVISRAGVKIE